MGPSVDGNLVAAVDKSLKTKDLWPARDAILMGILDIVEEVDDADKLRPYANRVAVRLLTHFMCIRLLSFFRFVCLPHISCRPNLTCLMLRAQLLCLRVVRGDSSNTPKGKALDILVALITLNLVAADSSEISIVNISAEFMRLVTSSKSKMGQGVYGGKIGVLIFYFCLFLSD